jgi:hypothetical protein
MLFRFLFVITCLTWAVLADDFNDCVYPTPLYPIDLRVFGNSNGTAKFIDIPDEDPSRRRMYSFNGCFSFGKNAAVIMSKFPA